MVHGFDTAVGDIALLAHNGDKIVSGKYIMEGSRFVAVKISRLKRSEKPFPFGVIQPEERYRFLCLFIKHQRRHPNDVLFHFTAISIDHPIFFQEITRDITVVQVPVVDDGFACLVAIGIKHFHHRGIMHGQLFQDLLIVQVIVLRVVKIIRRKGIQLPGEDPILHDFKQTNFRTFGTVAEHLPVLAVIEANGPPDFFAFEDVIGLDGIRLELIADS